MKKFISLMIVAVMILTSVAAFATPVATQHTIKNNVYIEGKVGTFVEGKPLLLTITRGDEVLYINNYDTVKADGTYAIKFKHQGDLEGASVNVKYADEDVTDSVVNATATPAIIEADVYVADKSDRSFDLVIDQTIPSHYFGTSATTMAGESIELVDHTYQETYIIPEREGLKAVVDIKNKYGYEEEFVVMVTAYDKNNKMLDCKVKTFTADYAENGEKITYDAVEIDVPETTVSAKAFCWSGTTSLIPYGKEADGALPVVDVFCVGDSTGDTWDRISYPQAGWGTYLQDYLNEEYAKVYYDGAGETYCTSGAWAQSILNNPDDSRYGTGSFYGGGNWDRMEANSLYTEGDYVIVSLGINDVDEGDKAGLYSDDEWYGMALEEMVARTKAKGTNLILCTGVHNGSHSNSTGRIRLINKTIEIAKKYNIPLLDINAVMQEHYKTMTEEEVMARYYLDRDVAMKPVEEGGFGLTQTEIEIHRNGNIRAEYDEDGNIIPKYDTQGKEIKSDSTHPNIRGANLVCQIMTKLLAESNSDLRFYVK